MRWDTCHTDGCDNAILPGSRDNKCLDCREPLEPQDADA